MMMKIFNGTGLSQDGHIGVLVCGDDIRILITNGVVSMGITTFVTIVTKDGCFDEFYDLAKKELAFTRQSKGCKSILVSTNRKINTMKMVQFWEDEASFDKYFEKRVERSGADFARLLEGPPEKEHFSTENFGYEH